jgi:pimeloyl-ACP methyl ester carboxylesterase
MENLRRTPFVRQSGSGPSVVCLHANASSSSQWRGLMEMLVPSHSLFAPDLYGAGKSPDWHSDRDISLQDEVRFLDPVLIAAGKPHSFVGHSYGAAVALIAAVANPGSVKAMALFEPTLFSLADHQNISPNGTEGIKSAVVASAQALDDGDTDAAARHFIDYWMGSGSWDLTPAQRKPAVAESMVNVRRWGHALMTDKTPAAAFASLNFPVLYMLGDSSPRSAHAVSEVLISQLPNVKAVRFAGLGHMAPVTHPDVINAEIVQFLRDVYGDEPNTPGKLVVA